MFRRSVRITCLVVGVLATVGLTLRAIQDESSLIKARRDADAADRSVVETVQLLLDLRASLHAYVAPGQGLPFWSKRALDTIDSLKQKLQAIDDSLARSGRSLQESLDSMDQLVAGERRARAYANRQEMQLAGDVIFTELRDHLATAVNQVQSVRADLRRDSDRLAASMRSEQMMLAAAAIAMWIVIAVLLLPSEAKPEIKEPGEWRNELKETLKKPVAPPAPVAVVPVTPAPTGPIAPVIEVAFVRQASEICSDLSALADTGALQGVLERVTSLLNATGLIVWVASNDAASLSPVATHGFDPKLVSRIGKVPRDSANLTAAAFRDNAARMSEATSTTPAALAVPMVGPSGPSGVLSVELKAGQAVEESKVALASIVAAQLATLAMPIAEAPPAIVEPERAVI
jgi:hypothetical protein